MIPVLPRGVRLHHDRVRGVPVLLAPEHALMLDEIGAAILTQVDGVRPLEVIGAALAERYGAPVEEVGRDVAEFLGGLAARRLVDWR